ncbi:DNA ligase [Photobacterium sp.]|uniref:DNA ligase n=1 Tax=Photobacterium sp. TaxID=660 RepID=UPI00299D6474|nr:DNA ligase [Photobacterium sp.]MDX1302867.1 DNA ligase [Photobacterium sp.]
MKLSQLSIAITLILYPINQSLAASPLVMQAQNFDPTKFEPEKTENTAESQNEITDYLISEKLDGIRAYWTGKALLTRTGKAIAAPEWFTAPLPDMPLDGELWVGRGKFQQVAQTVLDQFPDDRAWRSIRYMIFDLPESKANFEHRYQHLTHQINTIKPKHIQVIEQRRIASFIRLEDWLQQVDEENGEGLMLHHRGNFYQAGRSDQLLKLKRYQDAEAVVIGYEEGNGKFKGIMGSMWVLTSDKIKFKIGTGFNQYDRENPPQLGTTVTYRYNGYTDSGIPRFARFIRTRTNPDI